MSRCIALQQAHLLRFLSKHCHQMSASFPRGGENASGGQVSGHKRANDVRLCHDFVVAVTRRLLITVIIAFHRITFSAEAKELSELK